MDASKLNKLLTTHGDAKKDGDKLVMSAEKDVTVFASIGNAQIAMEGVREFTAEGEVFSVRTSKSQFIVMADDVRAFKVEARKPSAGYGAR